MTRTSHYAGAIAVLMALAITLQVWRDRGWKAYEPATPIMWLRAGPAMNRMLLGFDSLAADLYWIRAVVYFGRQRQSDNPDTDYGLLYPLLDLVTTLDPRFVVAYRFGAIFLSEAPPNGPGRPDLAIILLERAAVQSPERWEYLHDLGFVQYWHNRDFKRAAESLERAASVPGSPFWLKSTAASMHSESGDRESARMLWREIRESADNDQLRNIADLRLLQFQAMDAIDQLDELLSRFQSQAGRLPQSWQELIATRVLQGIPLDPSGIPFELDTVNGKVSVAERSTLWPLPQGFTATPRR